MPEVGGVFRRAAAPAWSFYTNHYHTLPGKIRTADMSRAVFAL
jgi:hypothetical protein